MTHEAILAIMGDDEADGTAAAPGAPSYAGVISDGQRGQQQGVGASLADAFTVAE